MLEYQNISQSFSGSPALHEVSLKVFKGKTNVLIGSSGCGKSTMLRLGLGLLFPQNGTVLFNNEPLTIDYAPQARLKMGYVIQSGGLFPHLTARENISLQSSWLKWSVKRIDARISDLIELTRFPLAGLDKYPSELSGGQRQRVSLMRALMPDPELLLLDEALGALDPIIRSDLQNDLKQIFIHLHKTVLMVTHDMGEAAFFGDHIILMREGQIIQDGTLDDLVNRPQDPFVTKFINAQRSQL